MLFAHGFSSNYRDFQGILLHILEGSVLGDLLDGYGSNAWKIAGKTVGFWMFWSMFIPQKWCFPWVLPYLPLK